MADLMTSMDTPAPVRSRSGWSVPSRIVRGWLTARLNALDAGSLTLTLPDGGVVHHQGSRPGPKADLVFHEWRALWRLIAAGDVGLAIAYRYGSCSSSDIKALLTFGAVNGHALTQSFGGSLISRLWIRLLHRLRVNTRRGSRRNIAAHYDLGNAFYECWLDDAVNYSSALYTRHVQSLEDAQQEKLRRIAELLDTGAEHRVLEIGCGWGALAEYLLQHSTSSVTGITLSTEQLAYAHTRLAAHQGASLQLLDYRDVQGRYDRIASIEMLEAVGERYWATYFRKLRDCLVEDGIAVLQVITIAESQFEAYRRCPDFIQRFIFPGGMLPTVEIIKRLASGAGLELTLHQDFGGSYARTLLEWRRRFLRRWEAIAALGFDDRFKRLWEYYLAYCEVGFETGMTSVGLFKFRVAAAAEAGRST